MLVVDTTILRYAAGAEHPLRDACRRLVDRFLARDIDLATTVEVIQEFAHGCARRRSREAAVLLARDYARILPLISTVPKDLELGLAIFESTPTLGAFDSILAATAINHRAEALISGDQAFGEVTRLRWLDPRSPEIVDRRQ